MDAVWTQNGNFRAFWCFFAWLLNAGGSTHVATDGKSEKRMSSGFLGLGPGLMLVDTATAVVGNLAFSQASVLPANMAVEEAVHVLFEKELVFSSFDPAAVDRIRVRNPRLPIAVITQKPWATPAEAGGGKLYPAINSTFKNLNEKNIRLARAAGT